MADISCTGEPVECGMSLPPYIWYLTPGETPLIRVFDAGHRGIRPIPSYPPQLSIR